MTGVRRATSQEVGVRGGDVMSKGGGEVRGEPWCRSRGVGKRGGKGWGQALMARQLGGRSGGEMGHGEVAGWRRVADAPESAYVLPMQPFCGRVLSGGGGSEACTRGEECGDM